MDHVGVETTAFTFSSVSYPTELIEKLFFSK